VAAALTVICCACSLTRAGHLGTCGHLQAAGPAKGLAQPCRGQLWPIARAPLAGAAGCMPVAVYAGQRGRARFQHCSSCLLHHHLYIQCSIPCMCTGEWGFELAAMRSQARCVLLHCVECCCAALGRRSSMQPGQQGLMLCCISLLLLPRWQLCCGRLAVLELGTWVAMCRRTFGRRDCAVADLTADVRFVPVRIIARQAAYAPLLGPCATDTMGRRIGACLHRGGHVRVSNPAQPGLLSSGPACTFEHMLSSSLTVV
jgi:hypothetical protein